MASVRWIISTAREIFLLLAVAIGTILGRVKVRGFAIGTTACTLIVAVLKGQFGPFTFALVLRGIPFSLFVFTISYRSGPEFFASLSEWTRHLWRARRRHDGRRRRDRMLRDRREPDAGAWRRRALRCRQRRPDRARPDHRGLHLCWLKRSVGEN
jgi:hypothetical protein